MEGFKNLLCLGLDSTKAPSVRGFNISIDMLKNSSHTYIFIIQWHIRLTIVTKSCIIIQLSNNLEWSDHQKWLGPPIWFKPRYHRIQQILGLELRWKKIFSALKTSEDIWDGKTQRTITSRFPNRFKDTENDSYIWFEIELSPCQKHTYLINV